MPDEVSVTVETPTPETPPPSEPAVIVVATTPPPQNEATLVELAQQTTRLETSLSTFQSEIRAEVSALRSEIPSAVSAEIERLAAETTENEVIEVIPEPIPAVAAPKKERHPIAVLFLGRLP